MYAVKLEISYNKKSESVTKCVIIVGVQFWVAIKLWKLGRYTFTLKECEFSYVFIENI
jgi:hypothetical protein